MKDYLLKILNTSSAKELLVNGKALSQEFKDLNSLQKNEDGYFFDGKDHILYIKVDAGKEID